MIGGVVIDTVVLKDKVWVNVKDRTYRETCAIYVEKTPESRSISNGDSLWWQGNWAMWTPRNRAFEDRRLARIGFSGVDRPQT